MARTALFFAFVALAALARSSSGAELTATRTGVGTGYNNADDWSGAGGAVPINNLTNQFNVIIPAGFNVTFDVDPPSQVNDFTLAPGATFTVPGGHRLTVLDDAAIGGSITVNSTNALFEAMGDGAAFNPSGARLFVTGSGTIRIAATSFSNTSFNGGIQFSAEGGTVVSPSLLDLSSLQSYTDTRDASGSPVRIVSATNNGVIDMHNVGTIVGPSGGGDALQFQANSGGTILLGNFNASGNVRFSADGSETSIEIAGSVNLASPSTLALTNAAKLGIGGDFLFNYTSEAAWNLDAGIMAFEGPKRHFLEVGGQDLGVNGATSGNFGIGQLVVGTESEPALAILTEINNNGNRIGDDREALYLYGLGGPDGLRLLSGSILVIGNIDTYAFIDGAMVHLNSLFGSEVTSIPFDGGFIVADELAGDYDDDGDVDGRDFLVWQRLYGSNNPAADGDGNGTVGQGDLWVWQAYYGEKFSLPLGGVTVPEPSTMLLLVAVPLVVRRKYPGMAALYT